MTAQTMLEEIAATALNPHNELKEVYRIGDLAREFNVSLRTLRFYEDRGLIHPNRAGSTRLYSNDDRTRLTVILLAKNVGFSLIDIQEILKIYDGEGSDDDLRAIHKKFKTQLDALKVQKFEIETCISDLEQALRTIDEKSIKA
ncbi:MAG: MerR family DNA-binding transcriptional regulator [Rhizobiaceae bacterium]|nr:MerR family DNA-binding transcriptional regulator [Rhizobiaceae bacterium]